MSASLVTVFTDLLTIQRQYILSILVFYLIFSELYWYFVEHITILYVVDNVIIITKLLLSSQLRKHVSNIAHLAV